MDADYTYNTFEEIYMKHYNGVYPPKSSCIHRKNERRDLKLWILPWLEDACARKQNAYRDFSKIPSPENKATYVKLNLFYQKHVDIAKSKYENLTLKATRTINVNNGK